MNVSVVIPVYRSEHTLDTLIERLGKALPAIADSYEVLLVNDGSPDNSWGSIERLAKSYPWVRGIDLMRNYGQHNATLCGIRAARYEVIFTMDDDLQNPPEEMPKLLSKLNEGYDVVYGVARRRQQAWWKNLFSILVKRAIGYVMGLRTVRDIAPNGVAHLVARSFESCAPAILTTASRVACCRPGARAGVYSGAPRARSLTDRR